MLNSKIAVHKIELVEFCSRWKIKEMALFGSILREDFKPDSDIDLLVTFDPEAQISLFDMAQMRIELHSIFHRQVDLLEKDGLRNPYRKHEILTSAQVIYAT